MQYENYERNTFTEPSRLTEELKYANDLFQMGLRDAEAGHKSSCIGLAGGIFCISLSVAAYRRLWSFSSPTKSVLYRFSFVPELSSSVLRCTNPWTLCIGCVLMSSSISAFSSAKKLFYTLRQLDEQHAALSNIQFLQRNSLT